MNGDLNQRWVFWQDRTGGGQNYEFMSWIGRRWREWESVNGRKHGQPKTKQDHEDFDSWLASNTNPPS